MSKQTKTDPRVLRTRELIEEAFLALLGEQTLQSLTVGAVAKRAGINRATFYAHFFDKYALFSHIVRRTFLQTLAEHLPDNAPYSSDALRAMIEAVCHYFVYLNSQCPPSDRQLRPVAETAVQSVLYEQLVAWLAGHAAVEQSEMTATFLSWAIFGAGLEFMANRSGQDVTQTAVSIFHLVQNTLQSES